MMIEFLKNGVENNYWNNHLSSPCDSLQVESDANCHIKKRDEMQILNKYCTTYCFLLSIKK